MTRSLSAEQFAQNYYPSEYGASWRHVRNSADFHRPEPGLLNHEEMVESVKKHGIKEPVQVYQGYVVDGHHRVLAAIDAKVPIPYEHAPSEMYEGQIKR